MERVRTVLRVHRALMKPPQSRNSIDIQYVSAETERLPAFTRGGPGMHRDLCHVAKPLRIDKGEALNAHHAFGSGALVLVRASVVLPFKAWGSGFRNRAFHV